MKSPNACWGDDSPSFCLVLSPNKKVPLTSPHASDLLLKVRWIYMSIPPRIIAALISWQAFKAHLLWPKSLGGSKRFLKIGGVVLFQIFPRDKSLQHWNGMMILLRKIWHSKNVHEMGRILCNMGNHSGRYLTSLGPLNSHNGWKWKDRPSPRGNLILQSLTLEIQGLS